MVSCTYVCACIHRAVTTPGVSSRVQKSRNETVARVAKKAPAKDLIFSKLGIKCQSGHFLRSRIASMAALESHSNLMLRN